MDEKQQRDALEYAIMQRDNRLWDEFNESDEEVKKECECGNSMDSDEKLCDNCKHDVQRRFTQWTISNLDETSYEYLYEWLDGRCYDQFDGGKKNV